MGILTGALLVGIFGKFMNSRKKSSLKQEDIAKLHDAKKIAVIGCAGSGKTFLTLKLQEKLQLPVFHLDQYHWKPNWQRVDEEIFTKAHHDLCVQKLWIIEGIYFRHASERFEHADAIIFLDMPRYVCLWNVIKRSLFNSSKVIEGNPQGCQLNLLNWKFLEFLQWIWNFKSKHRQVILDTLRKIEGEKSVYIITSRTEMNDFLKLL